MIRLPTPQNVAVYQELAWILSLILSQTKLEKVLVFSVNGHGQRLGLVVCKQMSSFPVGKTSRGWNQTKPEEWNTADLYWGCASWNAWHLRSCLRLGVFPKNNGHFVFFSKTAIPGNRRKGRTALHFWTMLFRLGNWELFTFDSDLRGTGGDFSGLFGLRVSPCITLWRLQSFTLKAKSHLNCEDI